jgi:nitrile hydratase subunit beta
VDGVHDLGGTAGFGPVERTPDEPYFSEEWERRAFRLVLGGTGIAGANGGMFRHSVERMDPAHYLDSPYYEHWLTGVTTLLVEAGVVTREEIEERAGGRFPLSRPDRGRPTETSADDRTEPRFAVSDRVRVRKWHPLGHTRAPRYVQGRQGVVVRVDSAANVPDVEAHGGGFVKNPIYSVRFASRELWGEGGSDGEVVHVDLWECYLEEDA